MVFWWFPNSNHGPTCAGSAGVPGNTTLNHTYSAICTGNNYGWMSSGDGYHWDFAESSFGPAASFVPGGYVKTVHISGHGGGFRCAT
jgi:hypothetical protein